MFKHSKFSEFLSYLVPVAMEQGTSGKQGLQRLLLLRSFVTVVSVVGLLIFQSVSELDVSLTLIAILSIAVLVSVAIGYWRLQSTPAISNIELFCHLLVDVVLLVILILNVIYKFR